MVLPNKKNPTTVGDALVDYFIYENQKKKIDSLQLSAVVLLLKKHIFPSDRQ